MPRLIDADALSFKDGREYLPTGRYVTIADINDAPTVDAEKHGHWIHDYDLGCTTCSECGDHYLWEDFNGPGDWNYCPNCGAKMDEERKDK